MKKRLNAADFISISYFATVYQRMEIFMMKGGRDHHPSSGTTLIILNLLCVTSHALYIWSVFCCHPWAWTQQFHYDFQVHYSLNTRPSHTRYSVIFQLGFALQPHFTYFTHHSLHSCFPFFGCLRKFSSVCHPSPTMRSPSPGFRFGAHTAKLVLEGSRWRQGMPGRRRRGPSASRGVAMVTGGANQCRQYSLAVSRRRHPGVGRV